MTAAACVHYWLLPSPDGPTSPGVCRYCGARREFRNTPWDVDMPAGDPGMASHRRKLSISLVRDQEPVAIWRDKVR